MEFLRLQKFGLRLVGFNQNRQEHKGWTIFGFVSLLLLFGITIPESCFVIANISDIKLATDALCPLLIGFSTFPKLVTFRLNRLKFYQLISDLEEMWKNGKCALKYIYKVLDAYIFCINYSYR